MRESLREDFIKKSILNFSDCRYWQDVHNIIRDGLELPEWYGENLDALWDSITGIMYTPAEITVIFHPRTKAAEEFRDYIIQITNVLKMAEKEFDEIIVLTDISNSSE